MVRPLANAEKVKIKSKIKIFQLKQAFLPVNSHFHRKIAPFKGKLAENFNFCAERVLLTAIDGALYLLGAIDSDLDGNRASKPATALTGSSGALVPIGRNRGDRVNCQKNSFFTASLNQCN